MGLLDAKAVAITGAGGAIGRAHAMLMAEQGAAVLVNDRNVEAAAAVVAEIEAAGGKAAVSEHNIASRNGAGELVQACVTEFGKIDVLINNAGLGFMGSVQDVPPPAYHEVLQVNVLGPYNLIAAVLPHMTARDSGTIINVTSARAFIPDRYYAAYCSSKAALLSMTQCLHYDLEDSAVQIFALSPGFTQTDMVEAIYSNSEFRAAALTPDQGQPPERPPKVLAWLAREAPADLAGQHNQIQFNDLTRRAGIENV